MTPIILDCDPGFDDAVAIFALLENAGQQVAGICTVSGNVELERTQTNARALVDMSGHKAKVFAGCARPIIFDPVYAKHIHGDSGIPNANFTDPKCPLEPKHAVDFLSDFLEAAEERSVTLCFVGPLTNLAMVLTLRPHLATKVEKLVIMGGAIGLGNVTPSAEFNIYVDPHAAKIVFAADIPRVLFPLEATSLMLFNEVFCNELIDMGGDVAKFCGERLIGKGHPRFEGKGRPLHDLCAVGYCLWPELFSGRDCWVEIDDQEGANRGRTSIDYWGIEKKTNTYVIDEINKEEFRSKIISTFRNLP